MLKARLAQEGLFDPAHKKPLPPIPACIGIITSSSGAAIRDVITVLKRRFATVPVIIYPCAVQGEKAAPQIVQALQLANQRRECDVLILTRGGGSLEDLWAFNEENVARAIYASAIPIISAIGHEIDYTIADFVADKRAPTPSAAAELVSPDTQEWLQRLQKLDQLLLRNIQGALNSAEKTLEHLGKRLRHPTQQLQNQRQYIDDLEQRLQRARQTLFNRAHDKLESLGRALHAVSPLATLTRGYAIVTQEKTDIILRAANQVAAGDKIIARLATGQLVCEVERII
jgi:exodeoxyribonuclease VII large subunit